MIRLQEGDTRAFDEIVEAWQRPLYGFFLRNTRDAQQAEDLIQDTLLRLYRNAWDYLPTGRFRGWLFRIARNLLIDSVRRAKRDALVHRVRLSSRSGEDPEELLNLLPADVVSPMNRAAQEELAAVVQQLLDELPDEQRQTFMLHHFDSLTLSEVADAMETSLPTAKSRLRLAKEKLRYQLTCRGFAEETVPELN
ncbi:MAG: sigma-70 family RNA polymerase sigma factor [Planctomycetaceae bacterium]